jgi:hypothetical protein
VPSLDPPFEVKRILSSSFTRFEAAEEFILVPALQRALPCALERFLKPGVRACIRLLVWNTATQG